MGIDTSKHNTERNKNPIDKLMKFRDTYISRGDLLELVSGNDKLEGLYADLLKYSERYVEDVVQMQELIEKKKRGELTREEWQEQFTKDDRDRTILHNALIDSIKILSRNMLKEGLSNDWIKPLVANGTFNRAACGIFAHMLFFNIEKGGEVS